MAIDFPDSPSVDEIYSVGDKSWLWNGTYWEVQGSPTSTFSASDTAPSSPSAGDIWYRSDTSQTLMYYDSTWVEIGHSANIANFLADADADTKIQLEESADEDTIRFDIAGSEKMALNASSLTVYDSLSVGSGASASSFDASGSGANLMPSGTTAERPSSPTAGMFRFNTTTGEPEWYSSAAGWVKFRSTLDFTLTYLIVAGGGGGAVRHAGGGGAGGMLSGQSAVMPSTSYTITVGAGGSGGISDSSAGASNGSDSSISTINTATGGGRGQGTNFGGSTGGSGGGGNSSAAAGFAGIAGQGNAGGDGISAAAENTYGGGGGGGAGAAGQSAYGNPANGGNGGAGAVDANSIISSTEAGTLSIGEVSGSSVYFAGGGGGSISSASSGSAGSGGIGGGGDGTKGVVDAQSGSVNTGGGGGAAGFAAGVNGNGGAGGSGVVVVKYPAGFSLVVGAGLTSSTVTVGSDKVTAFTSGTGTVSWV